MVCLYIMYMDIYMRVHIVRVFMLCEWKRKIKLIRQEQKKERMFFKSIHIKGIR